MSTLIDKSTLFPELISTIQTILNAEATTETMLLKVCEVLRHSVPYFDWVGFYLVDKESPRELVLGPYTGATTVHTRIPFGQGVCGQVAEAEETIVVQDVAEEANYLSCGIDVKSEIVVPLFKEGSFIGELDIDSHVTGPFSHQDQEFLEQVALLVSESL